MSDETFSIGPLVRGAFAVGAVLFGVLGIALHGNTRLLAAAAACGTLWTLWDIVWERVCQPLGGWLTDTLLEGGGPGLGGPSAPLPTLDEDIAHLEGYLQRGATRHVEIQAAIRLEEIYRTVKHDPERARAVIARIKARYPDARELARYS